MELNRIVSNIPNSIITERQSASPSSAAGEGFMNIFKDAMADTVQTDAEDKLSNVDTIAGTLADIHTATIAAEKADIALNLTIELRNKAVEAYTEIMRMSL